MDTLELIKRRKQSNSTPGDRADGAKLALVIEGGGMRGVVSAGMVAALETLGLRECFDVVYGASAGAMNGAYFVSGQARYGTTIYYQDISNTKFINFARFLSGESAVSLEYLLDVVAERIKPLDWDAVVASNVPLVVTASSMSKDRSVGLKNFSDKQDLKECLRASARIPFLAGSTILHRDMNLWDAMVFEEIPLTAAFDDNCTHILALLTHPNSKAQYDLNYFDRHAMAEFIGLRSRPARRTYLARTRAYGRVVDDLVSGRVRQNEKSVQSLAVQMSSTNSRINGLELRPRILVDAARAGFIAVYKTFNLPIPQVVEVLTAF